MSSQPSEELAQITDMLLAAGYFRARISNLSPFDKILGGMAWCITLANEDISFEFSDELNMGKKIALSESLVKALKNMGSPYIIQPHQIQGLDYAHLYPVIQWLVKAVLSSQQQQAGLMKKQASLVYYKFAGEQKQADLLEDLSMVEVPKRQFKTLSTKKLNDPVRVYSALMEFGDITATKSYENFLKNYSETTNKSSIVSGSEALFELGGEGTVNPLLEMGAEQIAPRNSLLATFGQNFAKMVKNEDISNARNEYLESKKEEDPEILQRRLEKERIERLIQTLTKQIEAKQEAKITLEQTNKEIKEQLENISVEEAEIKNLKEKLEISIKNVEENTSESRESLQLDVVKNVETLVERRNELREKQRNLKEKCSKEIEELNKKNEINIESEIKEWFEKIEKSYEETSKKYEKASNILAEKNQEVAILQRRLENTPSQTELTQYQRRFVELYEQINLKVEENRKFFTGYNSLLEVKDLLASEVQMLDSFQKGFKDAKKKSEKDEFAENVKEATLQVKQKAKKAEDKGRAVQEDLKQMERKLKQIEEEEIAYYQMVKQFQDLIG